MTLLHCLLQNCTDGIDFVINIDHFCPCFRPFRMEFNILTKNINRIEIPNGMDAVAAWTVPSIQTSRKFRFDFLAVGLIVKCEEAIGFYLFQMNFSLNFISKFWSLVSLFSFFRLSTSRHVHLSDWILKKKMFFFSIFKCVCSFLSFLMYGRMCWWLSFYWQELRNKHRQNGLERRMKKKFASSVI